MINFGYIGRYVRLVETVTITLKPASERVFVFLETRMRYLNRAAGGAAILLLLAVMLVSCNTAMFGTIAQADECTSEPEYDRVAGAFLQHARQQARQGPLLHDPDLDAEMLAKACAVAETPEQGVTDYRVFLQSMINSQKFWTAIGHPAACRYGSAHVERDDGSLIAFVRFTNCDGAVAL